MARNPNLLVDKRIVERNIEKGLISEADYQKHLTSLDDAEPKSELVAIELADDDSADEA